MSDMSITVRLDGLAKQPPKFVDVDGIGLATRRDIEPVPPISGESEFWIEYGDGSARLWATIADWERFKSTVDAYIAGMEIKRAHDCSVGIQRIARQKAREAAAAVNAESVSA